MAPNHNEVWKFEHTLGQLYAQMRNYHSALEHANRALTLAPEDQKQSIQNLILQLQSSP